MGPILNGLLNLQRVENRLRAAKTKLARCRRSLLFQENQLRALQNGLEAKQEEVKMAKIQVDRLELELKIRDEQIAKLRTALNLARTKQRVLLYSDGIKHRQSDDSKLKVKFWN